MPMFSGTPKSQPSGYSNQYDVPTANVQEKETPNSNNRQET